MLSESQQKNFDFFMKNLPSYLENDLIKNKFGIFYGEELKGVFDSFEAAFSDACAQFPMGEFIIQQLTDGSEVVGFLRMAVV